MSVSFDTIESLDRLMDGCPNIRTGVVKSRYTPFDDLFLASPLCYPFGRALGSFRQVTQRGQNATKLLQVNTLFGHLLRSLFQLITQDPGVTSSSNWQSSIVVAKKESPLVVSKLKLAVF